LQTAVSTLAARTKLLEPGQLDQIDTRLVAVQQHLSQVAEKKDSIEQTGKLNKVCLICVCFTILVFVLPDDWNDAIFQMPRVVRCLFYLEIRGA
jgi:hypothetical protein